MKVSGIYRALAILLCYALVIVGFIIFGTALEDKLRILDIVVSCLVMTQFTQYAIFPLVNMRDPAQRDVGMLGVKWFFISTYSFLAIVWMVCGFYFDFSFTVQLFVHLVLLVILLIGYTSGHHAADKVGEVYYKDQEARSGKRLMQSAMERMMDTASTAPELDPAVLNRLNEINHSLRYITPSIRSEAYEAEQNFISAVRELDVLLQQAQLNRDSIASATALLERLYEKRKRF